MPSLEQWTEALLTEQRVYVESSTALCDAIAARQVTRAAALVAKGAATVPAKGNLTPIDALEGVENILLRPIELLHAIGRITTPPVENLADISATWAILRYLWAFEIPAAVGIVDLHLSADARKIDFHQKGLLSDEVGIGMAQWIMENELEAPFPVDVLVAKEDSDTWGEIETSGPSPDYLFFNADKTLIYVVECKGSQSGRAKCEEQLRRGTEQVIALTFPGAATASPPSLILGTYMEPSRTTVLAIDPPGGSQHNSPGKRNWLITDKEAFLKSLQTFSDSKLLRFAGFYEEAFDLRKAEELIGGTRRRSVQKSIADERSTELGIYHGTASSIRAADGMRLEVFRGVHADRLAEVIIPTGKKRLLQKRRDFTLDQKSNFENHSKGKQARLAITRDLGQTLARSFSSSGTLLEVKLLAP